MRTTRGPWWPTVVLTLSVVTLLAADLVTWASWRDGYAYPYEYWREGTLGPLTYGVVGYLITLRVPGNRVGPLMLASTAVAAVQAVAGNLAVVATHHGWDRWLTVGSAGVFHAAQTVEVGLVVALLLLVPTGRTLSRFFHWCLVLLVASTAVAAGVELLTGTTFDQLRGGPSGEHLAPASVVPVLSGLEKLAAGGLVTVVLLAMVGLVLRWVRSTGEERRRVTWVVLGGLAGPLLIWAMAILTPWLPAWLNNGSDTWAVAGVMLPAGIGVAVLRHGLYELDSVVSRTVSYAIVSGVVVAIYAVLVTGISQLVQGADNLAVAAATLAAAASVRPLLRRVRNRVDRQFNRSRYDAEQAVHAFGTTLRTVVDPDQVTSELRYVLVRTIEPRDVAVWLRSPS